MAPTGQRLAFPIIVIVDFERGKVARERVYWDQAAVLVQAGLLDAAALPVTGDDAARALRAQTPPAPP